ncbi:MAG TPA: ribonuclease III [Actinomycetota bacterium]|nr:ribonuclease III [Actinomycetota bacterium]
MASTPGARPSRPSDAAEDLEVLGVPPEGGPVYDLALTHRSYAFEQVEPAGHNERLEFLGDAVLGTVVTDLIFTSYPELSEGAMARLRASVVNTQALAAIARRVGIGGHIRLGRGEELSGGRDKDSLLADTFEAVVGAVYIERGIDTVCRALVPLFRPLVEEAVSVRERYDAKTALQEVAVRERGGAPVYRVASTGPDHDKRFTAEVFVGDERYGRGEGRSKKEAEQNAAREALGRLERSPAESAPSDRGHDARAS